METSSVKLKPMTEDPLKFLGYVSMVNIARKCKWPITITLFIIMLMLHIFNIPVFRKISESGIRESDVGMIIISSSQQTITLIMIIYYITVKYIEKCPQTVRKYLFSLNIEDQNFNDAVYFNRKVANLVWIALNCESAIVLFSAIVLNMYYKDNTQVPLILYYHKFDVYDGVKWVILAIIIILGIIHSYFAVYPVGVGLYLILQTKLQLKLLRYYVENNINNIKFPPESHLNRRYQRLIQNRLKMYVKYHNNIKRFVNLHLIPFTSLPMLSMALSGIPTMCISVYYVSTEINPKFNLIMYNIIILSLMDVVISCAYGQLLTDECSDLYDTLCECPWYQWNRENCETLLMMLINTKNPFKVSCYGICELGHPTLLNSIRFLYSCYTLVMRLN